MHLALTCASDSSHARFSEGGPLSAELCWKLVVVVRTILTVSSQEPNDRGGPETDVLDLSRQLVP